MQLLGLHEKSYTVKVESALDADQVAPTDVLKWTEDLGPIVVTNFLQLQVSCCLSVFLLIF
jgi:hypothetical protein